MEFLKIFLGSILPLVIFVAIPFTAVMVYRLIRNKAWRSKGKVIVSSEGKDIKQDETSEKDNLPASSRSVQNINPKYYKWLICSVIGSIILFGGFIYAKGGDTTQFLVLLVYWGVGFINVVFWSAIVSVIAKALKKNWRNAFLGTAAIILFVQACITIAKMAR
jgi:hypothetical protein